MTHDPIAVIHLTDTHLHRSPNEVLLGFDTDLSLCKILDMVRNRATVPDLVLATGDLVHDGSEAGYRRLNRYFSGLGAPVYCTPGNHDTLDGYDNWLYGGTVRRERRTQIGQWHILLLDSSQAGSEGGRLAETELTFLDAQLTAHPADHTLICLHHNPVPMGSAWLDTMSVINADALFAILDRHPQVRALLWGHVHQEYDAQRRDVRLLASPSTCVQFKPRSSEFAMDRRMPGYRWLNLYADGRIDTGVRRIDPAALTEHQNRAPLALQALG